MQYIKKSAQVWLEKAEPGTVYKTSHGDGKGETDYDEITRQVPDGDGLQLAVHNPGQAVYFTKFSIAIATYENLDGTSVDPDADKFQAGYYRSSLVREVIPITQKTDKEFEFEIPGSWKTPDGSNDNPKHKGPGVWCWNPAVPTEVYAIPERNMDIYMEVVAPQ